MTYKIEVHFGNKELTPDKLSSRDVGDLVAAIEIMLAAIIERDHPTYSFAENDILLSLVDVKSGSSGFIMSTELDMLVEPATKVASTAITTDQYNLLPMKAVEALRTVRKFSKTYNA